MIQEEEKKRNHTRVPKNSSIKFSPNKTSRIFPRMCARGKLLYNRVRIDIQKKKKERKRKVNITSFQIYNPRRKKKERKKPHMNPWKLFHSHFLSTITATTRLLRYSLMSIRPGKNIIVSLSVSPIEEETYVKLIILPPPPPLSPPSLLPTIEGLLLLLFLFLLLLLFLYLLFFFLLHLRW